MKAFKRMLKYTYKYRYKYLLGLVFLLVVDIIQLIPPKIIGFLTDSISKGTATPNLLLKYIGYIILIAVVASFSRFVWRVLIFGTSRRVEYDMRSKLFRHLQKMSLNFYNKTKTGDLMALATNDLNAVRMALGPGIIMITDSLVLTITTLSVMFSVNVKLTLLCIIPLPFIALLAIKFGSKIQKRFTKVQEAFSKLTDMIQENFSGIRVVKSFVQEEKEYEKFMKENQNNFDQNMKLVKIWGLMFPLVELIASLSYVILVGIGGTFVVYGNISLGDFMSFNIYLGNLIWPMMAIGWVVNLLQRGAASLGRIEEVLYHDVEIYDKNTDENATLNGDILINNLTFSYPNSKVPAISNINLKLKKGQTLGIIGRTGSGKSTLVNLLLHLYNVEDGKIFINGYDINRIPLKTLREGIGFVPQEAFLFSTTVAENINLPQDDFDMEKIIS
ncbi:MAG TPA: ABC transporter ATP-binding protein, partial [Clostridiaceae bacterium]|nr:ABC transporter ATP-binding protein [Clostridiaceae bacterium]HBX48337.1 ABC transporter ATP-binding protein [Clostridiaceae bacterium]